MKFIYKIFIDSEPSGFTDKKHVAERYAQRIANLGVENVCILIYRMDERDYEEWYEYAGVKHFRPVYDSEVAQ